jgi:ankyrin repeat protein
MEEVAIGQHIEMVRARIMTVRVKVSPIDDLVQASKADDVDKIEQLLRQGVDVNAWDANGCTALGSAASRGHSQIVQLLISRGADLNKPATEGTSPLAVASTAGYGAIVDLLLGLGACPNSRSKAGVTPLTAASGNGHLGIVRSLLDHGAEVNAGGQGGGSALLLAVQEGHLEIAKCLIEQKANPNVQSDTGLTALMQAAMACNEDAVRLLLASGADVTLTDQYGSTAEYMAWRCPEIQNLIAAGCTKPEMNTQTPADADSYLKLGFAKEFRGDFDGCIADATKAIELKPDFAVAYFNRGNAKQAKGDLDGAIADYTQAIALRPDLAAAYGSRALARKAKGDLDGANKDQIKAIQLQAEAPLSVLGTKSSCPECGAMETDRMQERGYHLTSGAAFGKYSCPGCKKKLTFQFEYQDKATGIQVLCGSCRTVAYVPPSIWCKTCGKGLSTGWQKQISTGREAEKVAREFNDPGVRRSRVLAREIKAAHGKLKAIHFKSLHPTFQIDFDFSDGKRISSGATAGEIVGFAFGYLGGGPNRLQTFLDEMGIFVSEEEIGRIKPGTTAEVTDNSLRFLKLTP